MTRVLLLAVTWVALSSPSTARAGGFLGLGIGTVPAVSDERLVNDGRSAKAFVGTRFSQVSLEGGISGFSMLSADLFQASASAKASLPLGNGFEAFGRFGLQHSWLATDDVMYDMNGNGYLLGAGFEYRLNLGLGQTSIWVDYQFNKVNLEGEREKFDLSSRMWSAGFTVGI